MFLRAPRFAACIGATTSWVISTWILTSLVIGLAQSSPGIGAGDVAPNTTGTSSAGRTSAASQLVIKVDDKWHFAVDGASHTADDILFEGGVARSPFRCGTSRATERATEMATDEDNLAVRTLHLTRRPPDAASSLLEGLAGNWAGQAEERGLWITNAHLQVRLSDDAGNGLPTLHAALEQPLPNGTIMQVPQHDEAPSSLAVHYDCWRDGHAVIELQFQVGGTGALSESICLQWTKVCALGWRHLQITQGNRVAFKDGVVQQEWQSTMKSEGTHETVTKFLLTSDGLERLRPPTVVAKQKLLKVEVRGPFYFSEGSVDTFDVTVDPVPLSVIYTCESDGFAEVVLTFEKAVLSDSHRPEQMQLRWRKLCGAIPYPHLQVFIKSDVYKNKTQAVDNGIALPGFMRPCRNFKAPSSGAVPGAVSATTEACEAGVPVLEIPPKDRHTSLELHVAQAGVLEPPAFQPPPDLSYDRRILQVTISQPHVAVPGKQRPSSRNAVHDSLNIKYTCFKDGVSVVMVTIHVLAHKPIDIAWRKRCTEPKVHVGKALTAPQAITIAFLICGVIAVICCLIFVLCGNDEKRAAFDYGASNGDDRGAGESDVELTAKPGSRKGVGPTRMGVSFQDKEEVTFH